MMETTTINPKDRLRQQQVKLRAEIKRREENIQRLTDQFEDNFGRVIFNSIVPLNEKQRHSLTSGLDQSQSVLGNLFGTSIEKYEPVLKTLQMVAAGFAWRYIRKFFR